MKHLAAVLAVLTFVIPAAGQVTSERPATQGQTADQPPKAPTLTPEQVFGPTTPVPSPINPVTPAQPNSSPPVAPLNPATTQPGTSQNANSCPERSRREPQTPGLAPSQRAGVSASAFVRPGVSAEQLNALNPGRRSSVCPAPLDPPLYPEPTGQTPRRSLATDEP
jgi:hypothetical protein